MTLFDSVRAVANASGNGPIDWDAVATAAKGSTRAGSIDLTEREREGYAADARDARERITAVSGLEFDLPRTAEIQHRHHWIDANVATFRRVMEPLDRRFAGPLPGVSRVANTGTMSFMLGFLARNVLGQYDPLLLAERPDEDHGLYFVHPNIARVSGEFGGDPDRFRRWIVFHEVTHAAEFGAAPWLTDYLETRMERGIEALAEGRVSLDGEAFRELTAAMTVVEGYAELLMDRAFDRRHDDLRAFLDRKRRSANPLTEFIRRAFGFDAKREQYERGRAFFEAVEAEAGLEATALVWERPGNLPTGEELDRPSAWLDRVDGR